MDLKMADSTFRTCVYLLWVAEKVEFDKDQVESDP